MGSMPIYHISKGPFADLDARFDGTIKKNYEDALEKLKTTALVTAAEQRYGVNNKRTKHFKNDWLAGNKYHWKKLEVADTLKYGLIQAIEKALKTEPPKRMEFFWVCADEKAFHVYFYDGPHQVTVMIFTPPPYDDDDDQRKKVSGFTTPDELTTPEHLFVVKKRDSEKDQPADGEYPSPVNVLHKGANPTDNDIIMREIYR
jgi:hypothetical protein